MLVRNIARMVTGSCRIRDGLRGGPDGLTASGTITPPARSGRSFRMPNIKQQKKRVRIAAEERLENLRYRSTIKTLTKRLQTAVAQGDDESVTAERRRLEQLIDRAVSRGALHRNAGARKKAQAARITAGPEA